MKILQYLFIISISMLLMFCTAPKQEAASAPEETSLNYTTDDPKSIIKAVEQACGSWNKLWEQKDVEFTYSYLYPQNGQEDVSIERYVFDTEQSWARYTQHNINVLPQAEGVVTQYFDGVNATMKYNGELIEEKSDSIGGTEFLRKANYFWFVMMFKLDNPGTLYEYKGQEEVDSVTYDIVEVTYDPEMTGKEKNDTFILYVNPETKMVDQFYFSLPEFGINDVTILMKVFYEDINGLKIPTRRDIYMASSNGYSEEPNLVQTSTNIKFNNGFTEKSFSLD